MYSKFKRKNNEQDRRDSGHDRRKIDGGYIPFSALLEAEKLFGFTLYFQCVKSRTQT